MLDLFFLGDGLATLVIILVCAAASIHLEGDFLVVSFSQMPLPGSLLLPFNIGLVLFDLFEIVGALLLLLHVSLHGLFSFEWLLHAFAALATHRCTIRVALH